VSPGWITRYAANAVSGIRIVLTPIFLIGVERAPESGSAGWPAAVLFGLIAASDFADGYVARSPQDPSVIADMRYTQEPQGIQSLWGIRLVPERQNAPVEWVRTGTWDRRRGLKELWALVGGRSPKLRPWLL